MGRIERHSSWAWLLSALLLSGCAPGRSDDVSGNGASARSMEEHFSSRVQSQLEICRTCHVAGGIADVENGKDFMLSSDPSQDLANLKTSWQRLGGNNPTSRILLMASGQETPHTGGKPWAVGSTPYKNMEILLKCFESPSGCARLLAGGVAPDALLPLLGSARGGHAWFDYCEGKPDSADLPPDPRSLVTAGINAGKAVYYNAYWKDCHSDPALVGEEAPAKTCGELRAFTARGETLMRGNGAIGAGWYFGGDGTVGNLSAEEYNSLWEKWGLSSRPDNFDQLAAERYGMGMSTDRNPYPLPGEDPNQKNGGSGQLPTGLTQLREKDGSWTGKLGLTCHVCHSGQIDAPGLGALYGNANSLSEFMQIDFDLGRGVISGLPFPPPIVAGKARGTNNALALQLIVLLAARDLRLLDPNFLGFAALSPNGGSLDAPAWWNVGHRPVKFMDGFIAMDALRADLGFFLPGGAEGFTWVKNHVRAADSWLMSLKSPAFPGEIDTTLAEQGAVLFHSKDLWAEGLDNPARQPAGGNGSCASCHGVYSPRYANDPAYLDTPALAGVASYIVPPAVIGTDRKRLDSITTAAVEYGKKNFFAYPEMINDDPALDCNLQNRAEVSQGREPGYLAPPLHGVWATAPYFHNGAVPNVWEVLKPEDRKPIWRRVSTPERIDQLGQVVMGFDTNFARAYDQDRLGWKYDALGCGEDGLTPYLDCNPLNQEADPTLLQLINALNSTNPYLWYLGFGPTTNAQIEKRKIYNTHMYGQGNEGHDFTRVLTDPERQAIVEYLKTL